MKTEDYIQMENEYGARNYRPLDVVLCLSAYSAVNQGHCHPRILKTLVVQAEREIDWALERIHDVLAQP